MGQEKLLELLNTYAKSSYEIDDNFTLDYIKEKIQFLDAWIQDNIEKAPRDLFRLTEEQLIENRNNITETEINNTTLSEEESEGLTEEEIIEKKKDKILANQIKGEAFWKDSTQQLINFFQEEFIPLLNENDTNNSKETKYSENMKIIKNRHRINVEDLNDNFELITEGLKRIFENVLSDERGIYKNFFKLVLSDLVPLWENILFLWIMYILKNTDFNAKSLIKYVYLNENDFFLSKKFDFSNNIQEDITLSDIANKIKNYVHEYQNCNLIIIPIIRLNNYENNYYSQEAYPGIFYHPAILNNKLFKPNEKFIVYPFSTVSGKKIKPSDDSTYITVTTEEKTGQNYFYLGEKIYGYTLNGDDLYYAAPFNGISNIREIYPKKYYSMIRTQLNIEIEHNNSKLILKNFAIKCYDAFQENLTNNKCEVGSITLLDDIDISLNTIIDSLKESNIFIQPALGCVFNQGQTTSENLHKISNFRIRLGRDDNLTIKNLKFYQGECISYYKYTLDEDYSYLIEYVPFKSENNQEDLILEEDLTQIKDNYVGDITSVSTLGYKDNDLLQKHFVWDNKRNNILEDKFVLRIGQHLEKDNLINSDKTILISDYLKQQNRKYFDYNLNNEIQELDKQESFYNSGTVEVGAYLNIPFIKNKKDRITYYPEFLSHTFGSRYLVPTQTVEYKDNTPDYFANKTIYRDYDINKDYYFQIYTKNGDEDFSENWSIKMIEIISQTTPTEKSYADNPDSQESYLPPVEKTKTMDELYSYYNSLPSTISDSFKSILPFFSQLCPTSSELSTRTLSLTQYYDSLNQQIKTDYKDIVNFFFNDLTNEEKDNVYKEITNSLFFTYENNNIYPIMFTHSRTFQDAPEFNKFKYSLSLLSGVSESEIQNNTISNERINRSHWEEPNILTRTTVEQESFDLIYQSTEEYKGYYYETDGIFYRAWLRTDFVSTSGNFSDQIAKWKAAGWNVFEINFSSDMKYYELLSGGQIEPWGDGIYPIIPSNNRFDKTLFDIATSPQQENFFAETSKNFFPPLCKKAYLVKNGERTLINVTAEPIIKTNFPQTQIIKQGIENGEVLDETYLKDYWEKDMLKYDGSQYIYYGFSSISNFEIIEKENNDDVYTNPFKTMIFGANIPLIKQDEPQNLNKPRVSDTEKTGLAIKKWYDDDYMFGQARSGEMFGRLLEPPAQRTPGEPNTSYLRGLYGTSSFKKINLAMDMQPYIQLMSYEDGGIPGDYDISYSKGQTNKLSFNSKTSSLILPFFKVFYIPHLNYNTLQIRQYPHIFLYSIKTLFPDSSLLTKLSSKKISYKIYKDTNKNIASLRDFYKKLAQIDKKKIPYPFPTTKNIITIKFSTTSSQPSLSKALNSLFDKNFITNYNEGKSRRPGSPINLEYSPYMPCFLDYSAKRSFIDIRDTTLITGFKYNMITAELQERKASPIDIFEERYKYHNQYVSPGSETGLNSYIHRPMFYGILADMQKSLKAIAAGSTSEYEKFGISNNFFKMSCESIYSIDNNKSDERTAYTNNDNSFLNIDSPLSYEKDNSPIYQMNLQIIIHWFGPDGKYARKVLTRQAAGTPLDKDYFILGEHDFIYREWTNTWTTSTYDNGYSFAQFESNLANQSLFKQSPALNTLDFETYKNNGRNR